MVHRRRSPSIELLVTRFVAHLTQAIEQEIDARSRALAAEYLAAALPAPRLSAKPKVSATESRTPGEGAPQVPSSAVAAPAPSRPAPDHTSDLPSAPTDSGLAPRARRERSPSRARRPRATAHITRDSRPADPGQESRDAELARLRTLLKPTQYEGGSADPPSPSSSAPVVPLDASEAEPLRLLETEIRDQVHALAQLGTARCTARIAAWTGRVRGYEEESGNRMAAQLMLEKLRALAYAMEANHIEALTASWRTADWSSYIRKNEELAEAPPPPSHERPDEPTPEAAPKATQDAAQEAAGDGSDYGAAWS